MSYELGFSSEFFLAPGEPYDVEVALTYKPVSVWQAIVCLKKLRPLDWKDLARDVFNLEPQFLTYEMVFDKVKETNKCKNCSVPVQVYICAQHWIMLEIWE